MIESTFETPKYITPLSWIVVLMAAIKEIDEFYDYKGIKSTIVLIIGIGACIIFFINFRKTKVPKKSSRQRGKLYLLGVFASLFLLVLPSIFSLVYPTLIEPKIIKNGINKYLKTRETPSFLFTTEKIKAARALIEIDKKVADKTFDLANGLLQEANKYFGDKDILLSSYSNFLHAKIHTEKGNFNESLNLINANIKNSENRDDDFWNRFRAINLNLKAITLSRQAEGVESANFLVIYDAALAEADKLNDKKLVATFNLAKAAALYRIGISTKSDSIWNLWSIQSGKAINLFHELNIPEELDAISNNLNGLRTQYSIYTDNDPNDKKLNHILKQHDSIFAIGEKLIAIKAINNESSKLWTINSLLFDFFTREPAISTNYDLAYKRIKDIEPQKGSENYQFIGQWHQVCGLIQKKRGYDTEATSELLQALKIWHENKQIAKERELINDLLEISYTKENPEKSNRVELLFRWAGLRLLQKNFDPNLKEKSLLTSVLKRLEKENLIAASIK